MSDFPVQFLVACNLVLEAEGGYSNDPRDPGGETRFGISKRAYPELNIKELTLADAMAIYFRDYWLPAGCPHYPPGLAVAVFDAAVNQGVKASITMLQSALEVAVDGIVGASTVKAANINARTSLVDFTTARLLRYQALPEFKVYGKGWTRRTVRAALAARDA